VDGQIAILLWLRDRFALLGALSRGQAASRSHDRNARFGERADKLLVLLDGVFLVCAPRLEVGLADHDEIALLDGIGASEEGAVWRVNRRHDDIMAIGGDDAVAQGLATVRGAAAHGPVRGTSAK
jgi:hypothetical protein